MKKLKILLGILASLLCVGIVMAAPYGPENVTVVLNERASTLGSSSGVNVNAVAGNMTQLEINASTLTSVWQGYYGNITGTITLQDGGGNTMYDWTGGTISPVGEIYAANSTVSSWSGVICANLSGNGATGKDGANVTVLESLFGINATAADGFNETFKGTHNITIGSTTLADCPATNMYVNNASQGSDFFQTLLVENSSSTSTLIFAADVEQDATGFDGNTWDFQMIVADDGSDSVTTTYYFYVELV